MTIRTIDEIFRDFNIDGVPLSGLFHPFKPDIRDTLKALLEGGNFPDNRVIRLNNANEGTPNEIIVTASVDIPAAAYQVLYILNVTQENTGPVKVTGAINRDLVTNTNQPVIAGYLQPGMALLCIDTGTELRLLSYGDAEAIITAAEGVLDDLIARSVGAFPSDVDAEQYLADRSLTVGEGTIYFNTTDKIWKYWDGSSWQAFPYATVADGAVTDSKLPDFSPTSSPSAAKLRFQASSSAGVLAGAIQRPVNLKLSERLDAADFGVKADGVTNDTAAMVAALRAMEETGRPLFLPAGVIMVDPDALFIGNGVDGVSNSQHHNQVIMGIGSSPAFNLGSVIKARSDGGILFDVRGLINGVKVGGVLFDAAGRVNTCIRIRSMCESSWVNFAARNFKTYGIDWNCNNPPQSNPNSPTWSAGNEMRRFYISSGDVAGYGAGLLLDGKINTNRDPHRNTFQTGVIQVNKGPSGQPTKGIDLRMTDSNTFIEVDADAIGSTGVGYSIQFNALGTPGHRFPQNNFFYGCSLKTFTWAEDVNSDALIGNNYFVCFPTRDQESIPSHPSLIGFTDMGVHFHSLRVQRDVASLDLGPPNGVIRYRMINNSNNANSGPLIVQRTTNAGSSWDNYLAVGTDGRLSIYLPGIGFKAIEAGAIDTGGTGFRRLVVAN